MLEHLEGPRLSSLLRRYGPLPQEQLVPLGIQLCAAAHYIAAEGVVHLDIKPSNIIMGRRHDSSTSAWRSPSRTAGAYAPP